MGKTRRILAIGAAAVLVALFAWQPGSAHAAGFTDSAPDVTCTTLHIDPATWVSVTFLGDLTGHLGFSITVDYNSTTNATADISSWNLTGHIVGNVVAYGRFGQYGNSYSLVAHVDMDCGPGPTTTTTECQDHTLACAGPPVTFPVHPVTHPTPTTLEIGTSITATAPKASAAPATQLPFTGGDTVPLAASGVGLAAVGAILIRKSR